MKFQETINSSQNQAAFVLAKAVFRASQRLGLSQTSLAKIIGVSASTITRLGNGTLPLHAEKKEGELSLLLIRLFRSLDSLTSDEESGKAWLHSYNHALVGIPAQMILQTEGLVRVTHYLDSERGRI